MFYYINFIIHSIMCAIGHAIQMLLHTLCMYVADCAKTYITFLLKTTFP